MPEVGQTRGAGGHTIAGILPRMAAYLTTHRYSHISVPHIPHRRLADFVIQNDEAVPPKKRTLPINLNSGFYRARATAASVDLVDMWVESIKEQIIEMYGGSLPPKVSNSTLGNSVAEGLVGRRHSWHGESDSRSPQFFHPPRCPRSRCTSRLRLRRLAPLPPEVPPP